VQKRSGGFWAERQTKDWFWIRKRGSKYFSSAWITCVDAVRILKGERAIPHTRFEIKNISGYEPVPEGVIELLTRVVDSRNKARQVPRIYY